MDKLCLKLLLKVFCGGFFLMKVFLKIMGRGIVVAELITMQLLGLSTVSYIPVAIDPTVKMDTQPVMLKTKTNKQTKINLSEPTACVSKIFTNYNHRFCNP